MVADSWDSGEMTPQSDPLMMVNHTSDENDSSHCLEREKRPQGITPTNSQVSTEESLPSTTVSSTGCTKSSQDSNTICNSTAKPSNKTVMQDKSTTSGNKCESVEATRLHPYDEELSQFQPHPWQVEYREVEVYKSVDKTPFTLVDTKELFDEMLSKLKKSKEFAMDLEHHSYRSFQGLVCIVQVSTREEDFVIDAIVLKEDVCRLNEICTDSSILKVLHGSERDVEWLQRDFGVFIVNLFDTQKAARALQEESIALAHILKKYCEIVVNKRYQLADWRVRPLPEDMLQYAREDSHFLLYIKDVYRNALVKSKDRDIMDVYSLSTEICKTFYQEPVFQHDSHLTCYRKIKGKLNVQQMECFRLLYEWRHHISKEHDESPGYTLPNKMMLKIAHDLPQDPQTVVQCCIPMPPLVHQNIDTIHRLVLQAIENVPEVPPDSEDEDKKENRDDSKQGSSLKKKMNAEDRLWAIKMVNDMFLMQLKLRPELRLLPEAAPLLKLEKKNGVT